MQFFTVPCTLWGGPRTDCGRPTAIYAPCSCGCSPQWYLSGSDTTGHGVTITFPDEAMARAVARALRLPVVEDRNWETS